MKVSSIKINKSLSFLHTQSTRFPHIMPAFISKYKIIEKIGEGSFSEVLKCEDRVSKEQYAAKILKKFFSGSNDVLYCAEIIAMQKLDKHPNVLYMHDYFFEKSNGKLIFIFELMDMSLYEFMKSRKRCMPESKVKNYLYQILKGLDYLHRHGLFHRDIKPENILVKIPPSAPSNVHPPQVERIKLADLGSIRGIYSKPPYTEYISTRWYRSPECLLTVGHYGPKMDIWATGCVFFEVLTMKPLFPGSNEIDQLAKIHNILGTPSPRLLSKLKSRSKNLRNFTKSIGSGLGPLIKNFTDDGQTILKLMLQYDPDIRSNARRLLQHKYFKALMEEDQSRRTLSRSYIQRDHGDHTSTCHVHHAYAKCAQPQAAQHADGAAAPRQPLFASRTAIELNNNRSGHAPGDRPSARYLPKQWQAAQQSKLKSAYVNALFRNTTSNLSKKICDCSDAGSEEKYRCQHARLQAKRPLPKEKSMAPEAKRARMLN